MRALKPWAEGEFDQQRRQRENLRLFQSIERIKKAPNLELVRYAKDNLEREKIVHDRVKWSMQVRKHTSREIQLQNQAIHRNLLKIAAGQLLSSKNEYGLKSKTMSQSHIKSHSSLRGSQHH